jgi:hypothetical protein
VKSNSRIQDCAPAVPSPSCRKVCGLCHSQSNYTVRPYLIPTNGTVPSWATLKAISRGVCKLKYGEVWAGSRPSKPVSACSDFSGYRADFHEGLCSTELNASNTTRERHSLVCVN